MVDQVRQFWLTPLPYDEGELLRRKPYQYYMEMREKEKEKCLFAELGLRMHACCATEVNCEPILGDISRLVGKALNNASIVALLMYYLKEKIVK
ncbi:hypothetical protein FACS189472_08000 [Alphaproteobacteria bacterium]|nr:hypothetical protein FACS189472_08000 [Alphaproteobacteria bacterium]